MWLNSRYECIDDEFLKLIENPAIPSKKPIAEGKGRKEKTTSFKSEVDNTSTKESTFTPVKQEITKVMGKKRKRVKIYNKVLGIDISSIKKSIEIYPKERVNQEELNKIKDDADFKPKSQLELIEYLEKRTVEIICNKRIPKASLELCDICKDPETSSEDPTMATGKLGLVNVHTYGYKREIAYGLSSGWWYCDRGKSLTNIKPQEFPLHLPSLKCCLGNKFSGAMISLTNFGLVHIGCINWLPSIYLTRNNFSFEGEIPSQLFSQKGGYCQKKAGASVKCDFMDGWSRQCKKFFHGWGGLAVGVIEKGMLEGDSKSVFCSYHVGKVKIQDVRVPEVKGEEDSDEEIRKVRGVMRVGKLKNEKGKNKYPERFLNPELYWCIGKKRMGLIELVKRFADYCSKNKLFRKIDNEFTYYFPEGSKLWNIFENSEEAEKVPDCNDIIIHSKNVMCALNKFLLTAKVFKTKFKKGNEDGFPLSQPKENDTDLDGFDDIKAPQNKYSRRNVSNFKGSSLLSQEDTLEVWL